MIFRVYLTHKGNKQVNCIQITTHDTSFMIRPLTVVPVLSEREFNECQIIVIDLRSNVYNTISLYVLVSVVFPSSPLVEGGPDDETRRKNFGLLIRS